MRLSLAKTSDEPTQQAQVPDIVDKKNGYTMAEVSAKATELERILADVATPKQVKKWLLDICEAEDIKRTSSGDEWSAPNWDARIKGIDRVMSILKLSPSKEPKVTLNQPTKIVIQVIDNKTA